MDQARKEFGQIYDDNIDKIYRFVFLKVNSRDIAEDLTAEAFTKAWRAFERRYEKGEILDNPRSFCYKTARNLVFDYYRKKGQSQIVPIDSVSLASSEDLKKEMEINSDLEMVMKAIKKVKDDYQDIIIWRYLDELSINEIAQITDKSEGATRVMIHRAMESLRDVLEA